MSPDEQDALARVPEKWKHDPWSAERLEEEALAYEDELERRREQKRNEDELRRLGISVVSASDEEREFAARDDEPRHWDPDNYVPRKPTAGPQKRARKWSDCRSEIYARKEEPWIDIRIGATVIATCRNGSFVPLVAPSGAGKSTLALQMLIDHATNRGPAVYLTYELDGDEAVARGIGQLCAQGWASVLRGEVPEESTPDVDRMRVLEREDATLANLEYEVTELRKEYPNQPVFVIVDYMQATPAPPGKERGFTANVSSELRRAAKKNRVVIIGVSQASTDNSRKMRAGELLGIDASATGAETSQIERDAYVILTLGDRQPVDPDTVSWKLSVAKYRMGDPDVVHQLHYRGRIGHWDVVGDPRKASDVRAEKEEEKKRAKASGGVDPIEVMFKRLVKEHAAGKREMCTKNYLREGNGFGKGKAELALETLVHDKRARLVEVQRMEGPEGQQKPKSRSIYEPVQAAKVTE